MSICQFLSNTDLAYVAQCSVRLHTVASRSITLRDLGLGIYIKKIPSPIVEEFGAEIQNLRISSEICVGIDTVKYIQRFCPNLCKLDACFSANVFLRQNLGDIFSELNGLAFRLKGKPSKYHAGYIKNTMQRCTKLRSLKLHVASFREYFSVEYPELQYLTLVIDINNFRCESIVEFFKTHQQIKSLEIINLNQPFDLSIIFELRALEQLSFVIRQKKQERVSARVILMRQNSPRIAIVGWELAPLLHQNLANIYYGNHRTYQINKNHLNEIGRIASLTECTLGPIKLNERLKFKDIVNFVKGCPWMNVLKIESIEFEKTQFDKLHAMISEICKKEDIQLRSQPPQTFRFGDQNIINVMRSIRVRI